MLSYNKETWYTPLVLTATLCVSIWLFLCTFSIWNQKKRKEKKNFYTWFSWRSCMSAELICLTTAVWSQNRQILIYNCYIMILTCKKSEFTLCQVCPQDDTQTTFKMLVFWMEFRSIRACCLWWSTEGRRVFVWLLSSNINKLSPELQTTPLKPLSITFPLCVFLLSCSGVMVTQRENFILKSLQLWKILTWFVTETSY